MTANRQLVINSFMNTDADIVLVDSNNNEHAFGVSSVNYNYAVVYKNWSAGSVYTTHDIVMVNDVLYYVVTGTSTPAITQPENGSAYRNFETSDGIVWRKYAVPYRTYELGSTLYACVLNSVLNTPQIGAVKSVNALSTDVATGSTVDFLTKTGVGAATVKGNTHLYITLGGVNYREHDLVAVSTTTNGTGFVGNVSISGGVVTDVEVVSGGTGYQSNSQVVLTGDGAGAVCTCVVDGTGSVTSVTVTSGGSNYNTANVYVVTADTSTYQIELEPLNGIGYDVLNLPVNYYIIVDKVVELDTQITVNKVMLCRKKRTTAEDYVVYSVSTVNEVVLEDTQQLKYVLKFETQ